MAGVSQAVRTLPSNAAWAVKRALDRPGSRWMLARAATLAARRVLGNDAEVFHDGGWAHRVDGFAYPDGPRFKYGRSSFRRWRETHQANLDNCRDWWFWRYTPPLDGIIVDVGAGRGEDVPGFISAVGDEGRVYAVEAHPDSFADLAAVCRLNHLSNVTPIQVAVMDVPGVVSISTEGEWESNTVMSGATEGTPVEAVTLPQLCDRYGIDRIDYLKMNIEGAERKALPGMEPMMDRIRAVCIACHDFRADRGEGEEFRTRAFAEAFLRKHGFEVVRRPSHPDPYVRDHLLGLRNQDR